MKGDSTLNVNVFTPSPATPDAALPVLVYIHGGGYFSGSPASPWYDGARVQPRRRRDRDHLVPPRLHGLRVHRGRAVEPRRARLAARARVGAREHRGLRRRPVRVTIAGQSAGGGAVLTLLGMPAAQHLFRAAWCMSGATADVPPRPRARRSRRSSRPSPASRPTREGFALAPRGDQPRTAGQGDAPGGHEPDRPAPRLLGWGCRGDRCSTASCSPGRRSSRSRAGVGADKLLVLGATDDEFTMVTDGYRRQAALRAGGARARAADRAPRGRATAPTSPRTATQRRKGTAAVLGRYATDRIFRTLVVPGRRRPAATRPTWVYRFSWVSPTKGWSCHCLDVPFFFDCLDAERVDEIAGEHPPRRARRRRARLGRRLRARRATRAGRRGRRHPGRRACSAARHPPPT